MNTPHPSSPTSGNPEEAFQENSRSAGMPPSGSAVPSAVELPPPSSSCEEKTCRKKRRFRASPLAVIPLFLLCVFVSFSVRTFHYNESVAALGKMIGDQPGNEKIQDRNFFSKFLPSYHSNFAPFTIESAMMYAYAQDIALGKGVPERDPRLNGLEDLAPYEQMNMALEWFLGWGWRIKNFIVKDEAPSAAELRFQDHPRMAQWMSGQLRLWASLSSGLIFLWLIVLGCSKKLSFFGAMLHAFSLAAVARATGQDIVRGEFCIPLLLMAFVIAASIYRRPRIWKYLLLFPLVFLAFASWDLCQMLFGVWGLYELLRFALGRRMNRIRAAVWGVIALAVLGNAFFVPFNRTYELIRAPLVCVVFPALTAAYLYSFFLREKLRRRDGGRIVRKELIARIALALLLPVGLYLLWNVTVNTPRYASNYSHFSEAMNAKLKFFNEKPPDPAKLSYDARIMWTPSMHSATWEIANSFFPPLLFQAKTMQFNLFRFMIGTLPFTLAFFCLLLIGSSLFSMPKKIVKRYSEGSLLPILFTIGFTFGFIYIVRYHEFLIIFLSLSLPLLLRDYLRAFRWNPAASRPDRKDDNKEADASAPQEAYLALSGKRKLLATIRGALILGALAVLAIEANASLFVAKRKYTGDVQMRATAQLIQYLRSSPETVSGQGIAANITVGPMLRAYAGAGVVMNPQFGLKVIRDATEEFMNALFHGRDADLSAYCQAHRARYVLYHRGSLFDTTIYSSRYIANAKQIDPASVVNLMYYRPDRLRHFYMIPFPVAFRDAATVYSLFRWISDEEIEAAKAYCSLGKKDYLEAVSLSSAMKRAQQLLSDRNAPEAERKAAEESLQTARLKFAALEKRLKENLKAGILLDPNSPELRELYELVHRRAPQPLLKDF